MQRNNPFFTAPHPNEAMWSDNTLPTMLFGLEPPRNWHMDSPENVRQQIGALIDDEFGRRLKKLPMLPTQISVKPKDYQLVMYTERYLYGITMRDVTDRMCPVGENKILTIGTLNSQKKRIRNRLTLSPWGHRRIDAVSLRDCLVVDQLSEEQIKENTVLPVTSQGLIMPVTRESLAPSVILPRGYFLEGRQEHTPSPWLEKTIEQVQALRDRASALRLAHWILLPNKDKPRHWTDLCNRCASQTFGPDQISIPNERDMPSGSLIFIKLCIGRAAAAGTLIVPVPALLPEKSREWISKCIEEEQARQDVRTASGLSALPNPTLSHLLTAVRPSMVGAGSSTGTVRYTYPLIRYRFNDDTDVVFTPSEPTVVDEDMSESTEYSKQTGSTDPDSEQERGRTPAGVIDPEETPRDTTLSADSTDNAPAFDESLYVDPPSEQASVASDVGSHIDPSLLSLDIAGDKAQTMQQAAEIAMLNPGSPDSINQEVALLGDPYKGKLRGDPPYTDHTLSRPLPFPLPVHDSSESAQPLEVPGAEGAFGDGMELDTIEIEDYMDLGSEEFDGTGLDSTEFDGMDADQLQLETSQWIDREWAQIDQDSRDDALREKALSLLDDLFDL